MKTLAILILFFATLCSTSHAKSLREAEIPKDLQSILKGFRFHSGDTNWKPSQDSTLSSASVFSGSAYCVFEEPSPAPSDFMKLAQEIRDGLQRLYALNPAATGSGGVQTATAAEKTGEAHFTWTDVHGDAGSSRESISVTVRVVPLRDSKIGVILSLVTAGEGNRDSLPRGPRPNEAVPSEDFYGRLNGKRVTLDALPWYDQWGLGGRVVLPSGTSVYVKDPYVELPAGNFPKIEPRLPRGKLVRLVGVLTIEHYEPPRPFRPDVQGYSYAFSYLALALESFTVVEQAKLEEPELNP